MKKLWIEDIFAIICNQQLTIISWNKVLPERRGKELVEKIVKDSMENVIKLNIPLKVEIDSGDNWYDAK